MLNCLRNPRVWWCQALPLDTSDRLLAFPTREAALAATAHAPCEYQVRRVRRSTMLRQARQHNRRVRRWRAR